MYSTPILFIIFKRYETALKVFEVIKKVKPQKLYVAADGPRNEAERVECERVRSIIQQIDWECELHLLFQEGNLGCKYGPFKSISWFFESEERGIILEDDCVPELSFFPYVEQLLETYCDDDRIGMIAGHNPINVPILTSYAFSRFKACWGWATWKRAWNNMDIELQNCDYKKDIVPLMVYDKKKVAHWNVSLELIAQNKVAAWDWPWYFSLAAQNQLCIFPSRNLVANIGFGADGTHCLGEAPVEATTSYSLTYPLVAPKMVAPDLLFEQAFERTLTMKHRPIKEFLIKIMPSFLYHALKKIVNGR